LSASATTSGPMPSPPMIPMRLVTVLFLLLHFLGCGRETKNRPQKWTVEGERRATAFATE
jgi:hypothetical protein